MTVWVGEKRQRGYTRRLQQPRTHADPTRQRVSLGCEHGLVGIAVNQALELNGKYKEAGCKVRLEIVHGAGHGGKAFYDEKRIAIVRQFIAKIGPR